MVLKGRIKMNKEMVTQQECLDSKTVYFRGAERCVEVKRIKSEEEQDEEKPPTQTPSSGF